MKPISLRSRDAFEQSVYNASARERQRRICVAVWAYSYEYLDASLVSDAKFDKTCQKIDLKKDTGDAEMDKWFRKNFDPSTGSWVGKHPYQRRLHEIAVGMANRLEIEFDERRALAWLAGR